MVEVSQLDGRREPWNLPYNGRATEEDVFNCFRLLLGRHPDREEWPGHSARAGEPLDAVVGSYVNSLEFARRRLSEADAAEDYAMAAFEDFRMLASPSDIAVGRHVLAGHYEDDVAELFRHILRPGMSVIDIGANIGFFTMLSASLVGLSGRVLAVEPNPRNARMIEASRSMNGFDNVTVLQAAAGRETGMLALHTSHSNGTTSSVKEAGTAVLSAQTVPCLALDQLIPFGQRVDLIKIDVEGAEYNALSGCERILRTSRPVVVSEFSPGMLPGISGVSGEAYLRWLSGFGYKLRALGSEGVPDTSSDADTIMNAYRARGTDHIDIVGVPQSGRFDVIKRWLTGRHSSG